MALCFRLLFWADKESGGSGTINVANMDGSEPRNLFPFDALNEDPMIAKIQNPISQYS